MVGRVTVKVEGLRDLGTTVMVNMSASPYAQGKLAQRDLLLSHLARKYGVWALYANQVGANDDIIFDGRSLAYGPDGTCVGRGAAFAEDTLIVDTTAPAAAVCGDDAPVEAIAGLIRHSWGESALVLQTRLR